MTQFGPPVYEAPPGDAYGYAPAERRPWSASAIAAFVLSLLGCLSVPAVLGLVLGVVGIVRTSGGRRRGMGLAIAALPISVVTGLLSMFVVAGAVLVFAYQPIVTGIEGSLKAASADASATAAALYKFGSNDFRRAVSEQQLESWLNGVRAKHGTLVEVTDARPQPAVASPSSTNQGATIPLALDAKFVNGPATVRIILQWESLTRVTLDDIEIDGSSPRPSGATKADDSEQQAPESQD